MSTGAVRRRARRAPAEVGNEQRQESDEANRRATPLPPVPVPRRGEDATRPDDLAEEDQPEQGESDEQRANQRPVVLSRRAVPLGDDHVRVTTRNRSPRRRALEGSGESIYLFGVSCPP